MGGADLYLAETDTQRQARRERVAAERVAQDLPPTLCDSAGLATTAAIVRAVENRAALDITGRAS